MEKIDNEKMWVSMLNYVPTTEEKERIGKALRNGRNFPFGMVTGILIRGALREQGLMEKKEFIRPAKDDEKLMLKEQIECHGLHWNLDRMELEKKPKDTIRVSFPQSEYAQMQQDMNELEVRINTLEERMFHLESKDMPLGGNSCV